MGNTTSNGDIKPPERAFVPITSKNVGHGFDMTPFITVDSCGYLYYECHVESLCVSFKNSLNTVLEKKPHQVNVFLNIH